METEGLETVHTSLGGNAVAPEGGSFLEPPSIAKVPGEEIFRKQIDQVPCLAEKKEKQSQKDEGSDTKAVVEETNQIAEQEQVADVTGTNLKMDKIEGPCIDIGEEDKTVKHVEAMEDGDAEVEGKPKSIEKEIGGPKKYEEGETNIEESVDLETSKEVSSFEPSSSQGKEPLSQTADPTINNLDNPETGEGVQDKRDTEDITTATHETQEKQTEEMYSQQVDKPDVCMVSETESEENVIKSPPGEVQNLILEKTAEAGTSEGENIEDEMKSEQNPDGLVVKHEENKQSMHQGLAMADESTDESRDMEIPTVIAAENNTSDAVPITITAAQDHSVIADEDKIMDVVANIVPDHGKEEMSKYEDQIRETFVQQDEAGHENENSLALISREIDTAASTECSEEIASAKEETPIKITGEDFEDKKEEKPIDTDAVVDSGLPIEKGLPPTDLNEKIEDAGIELQYKNSSELHISHSLEQETMPVQGEKKPEDSDFEPQEQDHEANGQSKDLEKHAEDASEARESMQNTDLEDPSGEGAITTEVNSKANEMAVEREETVTELESEEKLAIDDAGTSFEEEMQKKEEAHDEQSYEMATGDRIEEVTSDEVCSREFVDEKVEHGVQAAGFQEAEIPLKNGVEESYEMSSLVNEEVIDEPKITDVEEVIDEEKIKDEATQLSSELVFEEKIVESSPDKETETEMSKGDDVEEQMMEDNNAKVILRESIQEASVNDGKNAEKSSREIYEVSEVEKKAETNNNDEIPDVSLQASLLKEQESLQTENLTAEAEEKDEDGSSIRKDEDEENSNGIEEVKECSEKETLKGEEDGEQISPKNEPGENLERSASMVSSGTGDVALNETTQKTEEEIDEGVEGIKKEAEIGKEDGEEQAIDENDDESIQVESIKEVPVSMVPNDENNAEEFEGEIFEESVTAGTNVSITDATYQSDGAPSAVLETSTVKQTEIVQGEDKDTAPAEASPEEEEEHDRDGGLKRVEDNSSEIRLEGGLEKSDEETSKTTPVEEQAGLKTENLTPAENSPEGKKFEDRSSNKKDEDKEMNTGIAEEKAEENLEQILQNSTLVENPKQPINMICAETEADASSKMVDNREEEIVEIPRGNAEAELLKEETIEGNVVEERNINSLSRESAEESPIKDFQNAAKSYERSTEEMLESQIAGGDETRTNDEDCNSSLTVSVDKIDESFKGEDENITPAEASPQDEKEEHGSLNRTDDGNDNNPALIVTNQDSSREALKVEDFEQELQSTEPGEHEEPSAVMAAETEASTLSYKIDGITGQEESVTIHNIEESVKKEEHGSSDKEGEGNDSNPDLTVAAQESVREVSEVQDDSEKELPRIEPGEPEEPSTIMASETEADTLSDKIDDITGQEEAVTIHNIEEIVEKEEHGSLDKEDEGKDSNPDLTVAAQESVREVSEVQDDSEKELPRIELGEPEEPSTIMASETEADTLSDKIDGITGQEEAVTIHNIEETVEKEEHGSSDKEGEGNDSNPDLTVANQESVRETSEVQDDSEKELSRIEPGEAEEPSTIMASKTEADTLSDKIDDITSQEETVTIHNIEEIMEKEEHGSSGKEGEGNDSNPDLTVANQDSVREVSEVQDDSEQELPRIELGKPEEPSPIMASETEVGTLSDKIDDITDQEKAVTIHNIEQTMEKEKEEEHGSSDKEGEGNYSNPDLTMANQESVREASEVQSDSEQELLRIEPEEDPKESSTIMAYENEADTLNYKIDDITGQEEAVTIQNIEETVEKEEHGSSDKEGEGNDRNLDLTEANQDSVREALEVQDDFEKELQSTEPGEPEEPSIIMASETEASTLSDNIDDITSQEEAVTIHNIEETVEKEEHESSDKEGEGNDINPDLTVANQESLREASEVQGDSEKKLSRIEPGEPEEPSTIMASETEVDTLSDKIDDITGQEKVVTIHNIEETVEKEEHGSSDKEGEENDSNPDLTVANQDSVREASEVQSDVEQELPRIEPEEDPKESSTIMASETEADTLNDKIDDITGHEEVLTIHNIEETVEKEKKEGSEDVDVTKVERAVMEEDLKLVVEASDANISMENDAEESIISGGKEVEIVEKTFGLDSIQKLEVEEKREHKVEETKVDGITGQEEVVTIQNIEETVEKEEHGSLDKEGEENESNPDIIVADQDSMRETSEVQDDSEQELLRIEPREPKEPPTIMASETEADTLSDKVYGITGQEEAVTIHNIEETVEKEEHGSSDKEGEGNESNPDLTVANQDSVREASEVQEDSEKELPRIEPREPEEPSTIMASQIEADILSDKVDGITGQEEVVTIHNIEESVEKKEHGSSDKESEGNDSNPDLTVANQDNVREASEVQEDSEKELQRIEPGEPEEPSTIMASQTEADTLSDKIDDITGQEEAITIQNIEETVEKEEHGSSDKECEGNDSNPDLTVANQDIVREASEVQEDSEKELPRIEPGEPEEPSTIMASQTKADTLSDKVDDITGQEEAVTIQNIEETVEKKEHRSSDKEGEGNDSNPDLIVANQESVREASEVQGDSEQELSRIEPEEPEEPSTITASEIEASTLNDKVDGITGQEEVVTIHNIEETVEKEKKEGSEDVDVIKVERAVMEEDLKLVAEASDANISMENDAEESIISGGKEVETVEKTFGLDFIQKLEVEEKREHKVEETKDEDIKEVYGDTKLASLSVDTEKYVTAEEHTNTNISPHTTGETTTEGKAEIVNEMEESVITSVDKDAEKKVTEEENVINDQSRIIYKGDESGMLVEHEVHEIIKDNNEVPLSSTNEENPLHKETEDESDEVKPNNEVKDSKSEFTEPFEARGLVDKQEFETLRGKQGPSSDIYLEKASEGVSEKESSKSLNEISCLESESKGEILEEVQSNVNDSRSTLVTGITGETSLNEAEPEDKRQIESFEPAPQEKGPVTGSTERSTSGSMDIDAKPEDANFIENEDHRIPAASETEELENEMHKETPLTGSEEYEEETTNETLLGSVLDDKQEECSAMLPEEPELKTNEGNMAVDENPTTYENIETPQTPPQEIEIMLNEDMPINERDASKSVDPRKESIKEDEYTSNVGDEAIKCIEATSAERKEVILEEDNPTKKPEDSLTENVEANKAVFELEERTNNQEQVIGTEDYRVLPEENFEVSGKKLEGVSETEIGDQSSQNILEAYSGTIENNTEIQNKSLKSIEQSSQESQEVREETGEKTELRFETEGDVKETQNTDETVKDVLLTEEVHEKVDEVGGETLKSTEKDVNDTLELCATSTEDERVHEVNESSLIAGECHDATESNEQTTIISSDFQEAPTMEEMSLAKAINDEDNEMPAVLSTTTPAEDNEMTGVLSTTTPAEELDEMIKVIKEEDNCRDKIKATAMVEITETSLEEAQLDEKPVQVSNITSNDSVSLEIEAEACQEEKVKDNMGLELPSLNLASQIPIDDHKNIMREQVAKENADADDVQEDERASRVVHESKDHCIEELITSKIKEENEKSSEIGESPGAEAAANEAAIDQNPPEVISKEEQGISATTERREENMKGVEFREDDLRKTEDVSLQKDDDSEERDISQLELQPNKDIQNQSPNEVLEEDCGTPGETKEEIKEGPKLVSMTNSQGFEALQEDESTSDHTVPEEKSEEQNQTPAVALLSKENDCGTEMIIENIEEYVHVELPVDPHNYSPPKITEDTNELEVSGLGAELNTCIQKDSLNEVQVEESKIPDDASKLQIPEYETSKEAFESMPEVHGLEGFTASEETEIKEKHVVVAITDLAEEENRGEKLIDSAEIMHDGVIEEGTFEGTSNLRTELSEEAVKSVSEVHGHEVLAESKDTEIKVKHPEVTTTDMAAEENQSERTFEATEIIHDKLKSEEEMDVEISQKEAPTDLVEASEATGDIHEEEETSKTTTEHIEEHAKEVEIEVDELPSATMTAENTCSQKEETKEQEVCGSGVECNIDMQKNGSNEFDEETGRTTDEDSTMEPQGYENKIKDKEYLQESNKMTEITETGSFEKTSDLRAETSEETSKSVSEVHELEVLAESEHAEIKKEQHTEVAVTDLVAGENQNKKTIDATEVVHDELTNKELAKQDKQQFKEEKEDTENCKPINLGEETTKESHQIYDLKAEKSHEDKMENEIQNEEEFGAEISEKESLQDPAETNETTQDIHQGERDSDSTSEKPVPVEAETQETTERKKDAPQGLLQEPIVESTQGAEVGESEPGKATGIVDAQGFEPRTEIDEKNVRGNDESMSANISLFDMMQNSTRELQVKGDLTEEKESNEETRFEGEKTKSDEEKEDEEEGEEHKTTDSPVMVEASRDTVDVKVASKKHHNILSGVGSKVKQSISKVKKAITGKSSHPKQHSPK